jgi:hypothetical protein
MKGLPTSYPITKMNKMRCSLLVAPLLLLLSSLPVCAADGITVAAVGDIMMGSDFPTPRLPRDRGRALLSAAAPSFKSADIAMANLEGPLLDDGEPAKVAVNGRSYLFRTPPGYASNLGKAGINMVSLANNHALDFGKGGLASTKRALQDAGVSFSSKSGEVAEFELHGLKVGIISLSFGPPPRSIVFPAKPLEEVSRAAKRYDILILSIHNGAEGRDALHVAPGIERYLNEARGDMVRFAHDAIDRGADLVIGHGPHVPRAVELYRGRLIAYSLGNFATYGGVSLIGESGYAPLLMVQLAPDGSFVNGSIRSFVQRPLTGPRHDPKRRALRLMQRLTAEDFPGSNVAFGSDGEISAK